MSYFVGSVAAAGGHPVLLVGASWFPWSVIRVLSFVLLGVLAARPLVLRRRWPFERDDWRWLALALAGLCADLLLKAAAAPAYGRLLRGFVAPN
jgi:drug/metabolite transporter (DMT)-like permease